MIFIIKLEIYIANTSIFNIIIGKLYYRKKLDLIILFEVDNNLKIGFIILFYYLVKLFIYK